MDDNRKRDLMDALAEAIHFLVSMDDAGRDRAESDCKGDKHDPS
jgi:hypothetical protein